MVQQNIGTAGNDSTQDVSPENPATAQMIQRTATEEEPIVDRKAFNALNPASTTSSLDRLGSKGTDARPDGDINGLANALNVNSDDIQIRHIDQ